MTICYLCNTDHKTNLYNCENNLNKILQNYKKIKIDDYLLELEKIKAFNKPSKNKKRKCEFCDKILSSTANYKKHINSGICKKVHDPNKYKCEICDAIFASKQNLQYHQTKNVCKDRKNKTELIQPIQQNNTTNNSNNTTTNTSNTTNIGTLNNQNNVVINVNPIQEPVDMLPFRDVCYKIPTKKYLEYANNPDQAIKQFVKDYHLNPDKPERMNILNTNRRDNRVQLFDFDEDFICRWQTKDKSKVLELLCDRGVNALFFAKTMLTAAGIKLDPDKETKLNAKIKEYESNDKIKKKYVDMIGDLTYDYRDMVESNKKKYSNLIKNGP